MKRVYFKMLYKEPLNSDNIYQYGGANTMFTVTKNVEKRIEKFNCNERTIELITSNPELDNFLTAGDLYYDLFTDIFKKHIDPCHPQSKIRILIFHADFQTPVNLNFMD